MTDQDGCPSAPPNAGMPLTGLIAPGPKDLACLLHASDFITIGKMAGVAMLDPPYGR